MKLLLRLVITAAALWVAVQIVPGIHYTGGAAGLLAVALVFGVLNAVLRPILMVLTCPLVLLTLGLFILVLNGVLLWLTSAFSGALGLGFHVAGLWSAFLGALVVSVVSVLLTVFVGDRKHTG
jgi:putative membrane protein